jgi:hypothetical protein
LNAEDKKAAKEKALQWVDTDPKEALMTLAKKFRELGCADEWFTARFMQLHDKPDLTTAEARKFIEGF